MEPMKIGQRLREWREIVATTPVKEDPGVLGGREAEQFLHTYVQSHFKFKGANLFSNKRVPAGYRRREIDLIVVTAKQIHIIEVKNWSGKLQLLNGKWVQTNRGNETIEHPDLVADHQEKSAVLIDYLVREGISLDRRLQEKFLSNKVIFMNPKLKITTRAISDHPDVLLLHRLNSYLDQQRFHQYGERLLASLIQWCLDTESAEVVVEGLFGNLTSNKVASVCAALDRLATWDALHYLGTRVETGDLIRLSIGGTTISRDRLPPRSRIQLHWTRHRMLGLIKAITGLGRLGHVDIPGVGALRLTASDSAFFHKAGEPSPVQIGLMGIECISIG